MSSELPGLADLGKDRPRQLFVRGKWPEVERGRVAAVIGSRRMSDYGEQAVRKLVPDLVGKGQVILSGLMYGVDKLAHRICLSCGGVTVAVLGWGLDEPMRWDDKKLCEEIIVGGGAIVSEWQKQQGALWTFPRRDRIMAALSGSIYVVEAAVKSGALITADWGIKLGRDIWAVPGPVTSRVSVGTNGLLAQGKAKMWLPGTTQINEVESNTSNTDIYRLLEIDVLDGDEIARRLSRPAAEVAAELTMLEVTGRVEKKNGKYYLK